MNKEDLLPYCDELLRLALSRCDSRQDAEDLASDTLLAALSYLHRGGEITHPRTWLANTFMHKYNSALRKKYRTSIVVNLDTVMDMADPAPHAEDDTYLASEEAASVRRELCYLSIMHREVLIRYYYAGESVSEIARGMGIPEGTVKSRLSAGREKMKKGLEHMNESTNEKKNILPARLHVWWSGSEGRPRTPTALVENDLIAQNLLLQAYHTPKTVPQLARGLGIPTAYLEPIVERLECAELMARADKNRVYTDFLIYFSDHERDYALHCAQLSFVDKHFSIIREMMEHLLAGIRALPFFGRMTAKQCTALERYAIMCVLQSFQLSAVGSMKDYPHKARRDGGCWTVQGRAILPTLPQNPHHTEMEGYIVNGGHRTNTETAMLPDGRTVHLTLCEFDTDLCDSPCRFHVCEYTSYFKHIACFLYYLHEGISIEAGLFPNDLIEGIPGLENVGLIKRTKHGLEADIPILSSHEMTALRALISDGYAHLDIHMGEDYRAFIRRTPAAPVPPHLTEISESALYRENNNRIVMAAVRQARVEGVHLHDVEYCCPPVVLVYE